MDSVGVISRLATPAFHGLVPAARMLVPPSIDAAARACSTWRRPIRSEVMPSNLLYSRCGVDQALRVEDTLNWRHSSEERASAVPRSGRHPVPYGPWRRRTVHPARLLPPRTARR